MKYTEAITILWAVESVYYNGFGHCLEEGNNTPNEMKDGCKYGAMRISNNIVNHLKT